MSYVTIHGLVPDGSIDCTTAIQAALDAAGAAAASSGRRQYLTIPPGTYLTGGAHLDAGMNDVTILGHGAKLLMRPSGPDAASQGGETEDDLWAILRIRGNRNHVIGLELDGDDVTVSRLVGILINGVAADTGIDNVIDGCNIYDIDLSNNLGCDGIAIVQGTRTVVRGGTRVENVGGNGIRVGGNENRLEGFYVKNWHNGRGVRGYYGTKLWISNGHIFCDLTGSQSGSNILIDPGSGDTGGRLEQVYIDKVYCERKNGTNAQALKLAAANEVFVTSSVFKVDSINHQAVRLEDAVGLAVFDNCRLQGNLLFTPGDKAGASIYQGQITNHASNLIDGKTRFTLDGTHGLVIGKSLYVKASGILAYEREHIITRGVEASSTTVDTDIDFDAGTLDLTNNFAHSGIERVVLRNCKLGTNAYDIGALIENTACRVLDIEGCEFEAMFGHTGTYTVIEWERSKDVGFDVIRFVRNRVRVKVNGAARVFRNMTDDTMLITSGKTIVYGNDIQNVDPTTATAIVLCYISDGQDNRTILFQSDGERQRCYLYDKSPVAPDTLTAFKAGDFIRNSDLTSGEPFGWQCVSAGSPGTWTPIFHRALNSNTTSASNAGTTETDLMSYTLPANTLAVTGDSLEIDAGFTFANNANNKTVKLYLNGQFLYTSNTKAHQAGGMQVRVVVARNASNTAKVTVSATSNGSNDPFPIAFGNAFSQGSLDFTASQIIKGTGQSGTGSNDVTMQYLRVKPVPAP